MRYDQVSTWEGSKTVWGLCGQEGEDKTNHKKIHIHKLIKCEGAESFNEYKF